MYINSNSQVLDQRLSVQELVIPFRIIGHATAASVTFVNGLPGILYLQSEGANSNGAISAADASASSYNARLDGEGVFSALVALGETVSEVLEARLSRRLAASGAAVHQNVWFADADGISPNGNIQLNIDADLAISAAGTGHYCLTLKYKI